MRNWLLWMGIILTNLYAMGQQQNELLPQVADDGTVVWQIAQPRDLFQRVGASIPLWQPDGTIGIRILFPTGPFPLGQVPDVDSNAARPQISANGQWLIHHDENGQVMLWQILIDTNGNKTLATSPMAIRQQQVFPRGILPAISGNGRIIAFLSQDPNLNDPDGDNDPNNNNPPDPQSPPANLWLLYIHDRDADGDGVFDELEEGATKTTFLNIPSSSPPFVRLTEVRLSLDSMGASLAFSVLVARQQEVPQWELWYVPNVQDIQKQSSTTDCILSCAFLCSVRRGFISRFYCFWSVLLGCNHTTNFFGWCLCR